MIALDSLLHFHVGLFLPEHRSRRRKEIEKRKEVDTAIDEVEEELKKKDL